MSIQFRDYITRVQTKEEEISGTLASIKSSLEKTERIDISAYNAIKPLLKQLENLLIQHLQWQKEKFWDILLVSYEDELSRKIICYLKDSLKELKIEVLKFFDLHPATMGDVNYSQFTSDFISFFGLTSEFLKEEKKYLIPLLEKLIIEI